MKMAASILIFLVTTACGDQLSHADQARYIAELESKVALPEGAGRLDCYQRNYAFKTDEQGRRTLDGFYHRATSKKRPQAAGVPILSPGIRIREPSFEVGVADQGCDTLRVRYDLDNLASVVTATCFPDIDGPGLPPKPIDPPFDC